MKNTEQYQLKKSIFMLLNEFEKLCEYLSNLGNELSEMTDKEVCEVFSNYFDITVTSIHEDDCDDTGVWIVYK